MRSFNVVALTVIGGVGFVIGALVAGVALAGGVFQQFLSNYFDLSNWWLLILGVLLVVQLMVLPDGVASDIGRQARAIGKLVGRGVPPPPAGAGRARSASSGAAASRRCHPRRSAPHSRWGGSALRHSSSR